jgi:hypothetical protein
MFSALLLVAKTYNKTVCLGCGEHDAHAPPNGRNKQEHFKCYSKTKDAPEHEWSSILRVGQHMLPQLARTRTLDSLLLL